MARRLRRARAWSVAARFNSARDNERATESRGWKPTVTRAGPRGIITGIDVIGAIVPDTPRHSRLSRTPYRKWSGHESERAASRLRSAIHVLVTKCAATLCRGLLWFFRPPEGILDRRFVIERIGWVRWLILQLDYDRRNKERAVKNSKALEL